MRVRSLLAITVLVLATSASASPAPPDTLYVAAFLIDIQTISSTEQNFVANVFYRVRWQDPSLAHAGPEPVVRDFDEVWQTTPGGLPRLRH